MVLYLYLQHNTDDRFKAKLKAPFELLSDPDEVKDRLMYGRKVRGMECSTFVLDEKGRLLRAWRGVSAGQRPGGIELC